MNFEKEPEMESYNELRYIAEHHFNSSDREFHALREAADQIEALLSENLAFQREWDAFALHRRQTFEAEAELRKRKEEANGAAS